MRKHLFPLSLLLLSLTLVSCAINTATPPAVAIPFGEPDFPKLGKYWVIDVTNSVSETVEKEVDAKFENMRAQGYAQQAIVVMKGVKNPSDYVTQLARHLALGEAEGKNKNNGILWLVLIDEPAERRLWYTIGTGLPEFTSFEAGAVIDESRKFSDKSDWEGTVKSIAAESEKNLKKVYPNGAKGGPSSTPETAPDKSKAGEKKELTPEEQRTMMIIVIIVVVAWIVIGVVLFFIDPELGMLWFEITIRILLIAATAGKAGAGRSGSGGSFGGRSGR